MMSFIPRSAQLSLAVSAAYAGASVMLSMVRGARVGGPTAPLTAPPGRQDLQSGRRATWTSPPPTARTLHLQLNKAILSGYNFQGFFTLLFCQLVLSLLFCVVTRDYLGNPFKIPRMDKQLARA